MSKKCDIYNNDFSCERNCCRSRSGTRRLSSRKKRSRDEDKFCKDCPHLPRSDEKPKLSRKPKDSPRFSNKWSQTNCRPIVKKTIRIEHPPEVDIKVCKTVTPERTKPERKQRQRERTKRCAKKNKEKKKRKKKKSECKKRKASASSTYSRVIEFLFTNCSCLKGLDPPSSQRPRTDKCCRCCKCHSNRLDCDNKSVQCDARESRVRLTFSQCEILDRCESAKKIYSQLTKLETKQSRKCVTRKRSGSARYKKTNDSRFVACQGQSEDTSIASTQSRNEKIQSQSDIENSASKNISSCIPDKKKQQSSQKPSADKKPLDECSRRCKYRKNCSTKNSSGEKIPRSLLVFCDIVFWPYTCWSGRR